MQYIERSAFRKGEYVAYARDTTWRVYADRDKRGRAIRWHAFPNHGEGGTDKYGKHQVTALTLACLDKGLGM